ncbi:MAG: pyridoxamine 5'-phosphate oxidase [Ignavibacteriales bacterium]|nr:MAG: pyridoxamine 5'-phosphate oxidase [Ignavibacteriales bacterium]
MKTTDISGIRKNYSKHKLDENEVNKNPVLQFELWLDDALACKIDEPTAMTLATSDKNGKPSARIVLLKGVNEKGFVFYTNYSSRKGREIKQNPLAALVFHWKELERQVRIEGYVEKIPEKNSEVYFSSRPLASRISAIVSPQSKIIHGRDFLDKLFIEYKNKSKNKIEKPANWGGYVLIPDYFEFWQGRKNRLHDRLCYKRLRKGWKINRLAP